MSKLNIKRTVDNIKGNTTVYTPLIELIVNSIQAIEELKIENGKITITVLRSKQMEIDNGLQTINGFLIEDNGIGFTDKHRNSFDTLYSDLKSNQGGKGFGRFTCLKYFDQVSIESVYKDVEENYKSRRFNMGIDKEIIIQEEIKDIEVSSSIGSKVKIWNLKKGSFDIKLSSIALNIFEKLLPYFITQHNNCPKIVLKEEYNKEEIYLNDYINNTNAEEYIKEFDNYKTDFKIDSSSYKFYYRAFKFYHHNYKKSQISLVAHNREVTTTNLSKYIPEFEDEFFEIVEDNNEQQMKKNFIIKTYVMGEYLDQKVSLERGNFDFYSESDLINSIGQKDIENKAAKLSMELMKGDIHSRKEAKQKIVQDYVDKEAPWYKQVFKLTDLTTLPCNPTVEQIEMKLHETKFKQEQKIKKEVDGIVKNATIENLSNQVNEVINKISENSKNDLIHYVALRKTILKLFEKSLGYNQEGKYFSEGSVHDIIFPRKENSESIDYYNHNLWLLDERLNFSSYISSDLPLDGPKSERPDLLIYNNPICYRGENNISNPITVFEFKKPGRDNFVDKSSNEDPIQQIIRYVNDIKDGKYTTPNGRKILISENTHCYGYVICDLTPKVEKWLKREKDFKKMPDNLGWYDWMNNNNLYIEVLSWEKIMKDATMRNKIFFNKLNIN